MMPKVRAMASGVAVAAALSAALAASPVAQASTAAPATTHVTRGLATAPASVESAEANCAVYPHVCLWSDKDGTGSYGAWAQSVNKLPSSLWNKVSSFWNRLPGKVVFYTGDNHTGSTFCVDRGLGWDDLSSSQTAGWNDNIQSFLYYPGGWC